MGKWGSDWLWPAAAGVCACAAVVGGCANVPADDAGADVSRRAALGSAQVRGRAPREADGSRSVVTLDPHVPVDVLVPSEPTVMDQYGRDFIPRLLVVREGQTVQFQNSEDELHTVRVSDETGLVLLNIAMPILGGTYDHVFDHVGDYVVGCDTHQEMAARILVVSSPYAAVADRDGAFSFADIPAGPYTATVRQGSERFERAVDIVTGPNTLNLDW